MSPRKSPTRVGAEMRSARERCGLTLREAEKRIGYSYVTLAHAESRGVLPGEALLAAAAEVYGVDLDRWTRLTAVDRCQAAVARAQRMLDAAQRELAQAETSARGML